MFMVHAHLQLAQDQKVLIFNFQAPLCFVNSTVFRRKLEIAIEMDKQQLNRLEEKGCLQQCTSKVC